MSPILSFTLAAVGGILPPLIWLFFWLREDRLHPEPKRILFRVFLFGMLSVLVVIPFQQVAMRFIPYGTLILIAWALIEELVKFKAAYFGGLNTKADDEPLDPVIYMITAALGFAAFENVLFLIEPFLNGGLLLGFATTNIRFVGASVLHTVSSASIGLALAFSFYKNEKTRRMYVFVGILIAILIHAVFNYIILQATQVALISTLGFVWLIALLLIVFFEKVKRLKRPPNPPSS